MRTLGLLDAFLSNHIKQEGCMRITESMFHKFSAIKCSLSLQYNHAFMSSSSHITFRISSLSEDDPNFPKGDGALDHNDTRLTEEFLRSSLPSSPSPFFIFCFYLRIKAFFSISDFLLHLSQPHPQCPTFKSSVFTNQGAGLKPMIAQSLI